MTSTKTTKSYVKCVRYYSIGQNILHYQAGTCYYIISKNYYIIRQQVYYIIGYIITLCSYYIIGCLITLLSSYYIDRRLLHFQL
jgi:hypothetical protein